MTNYFNPRSPCGERQNHPQGNTSCHKISIHAPRAGSDLQSGECGKPTPNFNPRSPCGERPGDSIRRRCGNKFQSTLPVRGATCPAFITSRKDKISIHAPRAGSDLEFLKCISGDFCISIHAPRAGSDRGARLLRTRKEFQSTLPVRGATCFIHRRIASAGISIHAPRAGSDSNIAQISDDRAAILRHGFQTISPPTAEKSLSANKKLFLMPFSAREPPGFFMFTAGSRPAAGQKINVSVTSIEGLAPICFTLPSYAEPIT